MNLHAILNDLLAGPFPGLSRPVIGKLLMSAEDRSAHFNLAEYQDDRLIFVNVVVEHVMMVLGGKRPGTVAEFNRLLTFLRHSVDEFGWTEDFLMWAGFSFSDLRSLIGEAWLFLIHEGGETHDDLPKLRPILNALMEGHFISGEDLGGALEHLGEPHDHSLCGCRYIGLDMWDCGHIDNQPTETHAQAL